MAIPSTAMLRGIRSVFGVSSHISLFIKQPLLAQSRFTKLPTPIPQTSLRRSFATISAETSVASSSSTPTPSSSSNDVIPPNLIFQDGEIDVTDSVLKMLEGDPSLAGFSSIAYQPSYLPLSSLASPNPRLPAPEGLAVPLPPTVFKQPFRRDILHRCVVYYLSLLRQGSGSTKTRADVNKSGKKLIRQKGSGRARVGDAGSGIRRGGGTIHGPHPRDFAQKLPRKVQQLGLHVALSCRLRSGLLRIVGDFNEGGWSSARQVKKTLGDVTIDAWKMGGKTSHLEESEIAIVEPKEEDLIKFGKPLEFSILFIHGPSTDLTSFDRATRNFPGLEVISVDDVAAYDVLRRKWVMLDVESLEVLAERSGDLEMLTEMEGEEEFEATEAEREGEGEKVVV